MANKKPKAFKRNQEGAMQVEYNLTDHYSKLEFNDAINQVISISETHRLVLETLQNESSVYTLAGRINKSRLCELLGIRPKDLNEVLHDTRRLFSSPT